MPAPENTVAFGTASGTNRYYEHFIDELHELLCGDGYKGDREALLGEFRAGQATVVATLTSALAPALSAAPAFLAPAVALTLSALGKVGLQAWCKTQQETRDRNP
jgi:hypothetical protein